MKLGPYGAVEIRLLLLLLLLLLVYLFHFLQVIYFSFSFCVCLCVCMCVSGGISNLSFLPVVNVFVDRKGPRIQRVRCQVWKPRVFQ